MISTVTAVTTLFPASAGITATLFLIGLLIVKELAHAGDEAELDKIVTVGIVPLLMCFGLTVAVKVLEVLGQF